MRRYDLDWLRVLVFGLLIFYHVGMFFVPWEFHIKNNMLYEEVKWPMLFLNQWRMPILFVISGMGTYYALSRRSGWQFAGERIKRLFLPLVFGMLVIIPPQVYFERLANGQFAGGYFSFWPLHAFTGIYPSGNLSWNHLWFLPYLLIYSLLLAPLFVYLRTNTDTYFRQWLKNKVGARWGMYVFIIPLYITEIGLKPLFPVTHALIGDWFTLVNFLILFFYGFLFMTTKSAFWNTVEKYRRGFLVNAILGFLLLVGTWFLFKDAGQLHFIEALIKVFNLWSWILTIFGYAARHLNRDSTLLRYCNTAVYPFYILHQTITIIIGYYLIDLDWGGWTKASIMIIGTFVGSFLLYEYGVKRTKWSRVLFGLKNDIMIVNRIRLRRSAIDNHKK